MESWIDRTLHTVFLPAKYIGGSKTRLKFFMIFDVVLVLIGLTSLISFLAGNLFINSFPRFESSINENIAIIISIVLAVLLFCVSTYLSTVFGDNSEDGCDSCMYTIVDFLSVLGVAGFVVLFMYILKFIGISYDSLYAHYGVLGQFLYFLPYISPFVSIAFQKYIYFGIRYYQVNQFE